jgi:hypothetical protein
MAWIKATAVSRIVKMHCERRVAGRVERLGVVAASKRRRWPAVMFAESRTARVRGRIRMETDSIITRAGESASGLPFGTRWEMKLVGDPRSRARVRPDHRGRANLKVNER